MRFVFRESFGSPGTRINMALNNDLRPTQAIKGAPGMAGFGERLKCVRLMRGLTEQELSIKSGILKPNQVEFDQGFHIKQWEKGLGYPHSIVLRSLCQVLDVSADYLLDLN